ncbi:XRE family transcriptional regulator [Amycolatopsis sp. NBC_00345]|uniref:helix-turn-helix domain-containing protein n=1 Tax=Amycolatopsis sp. NBC_00345 TaxID=2975955 RepID=UPI002E273CFA
MTTERVSPIVGRRIRSERQARDWTVAEVADKAGVSKGLIGQLERGVGNPSLENLHKLALVFDLPPSALFDEGDRRPHVRGDGDQAARTLPPPTVGVVRADARRQLVFPRSRVVFELLTPDFLRALEVFRCLIPENYDTREVPSEHEGEEFATVLRGRLEAHIGEQTFVMEPGDSVSYPATTPHWWRNMTNAEAEIIVVVTPPSI